MGVLPIDNLSVNPRVVALIEASAKKPLGQALFHLVQQLRRAEVIHQIAIVTSPDLEDDPIVEFGRSQNIVVVRTPQDDLLSGFARAAELLDADAIVRFASEAGFGLIERLVAALEGYDYALPDQNDPPVDAFTRRALDKLLMDVSGDKLARGKVTAYFRAHPNFVPTARVEPAQRSGDIAFVDALHHRLSANGGHASLGDLLLLIKHEQSRSGERRREPAAAVLHSAGGTGRIRQMIALARALRDGENISCSIVVHGGGDAKAAVRAAGFETKAPAAPDLVVTDGPSFEATSAVTAVIGDTSARRFTADYAFYPPLPQFESLDWTGARTKVCTGWEWAILCIAQAAVRPRPRSPRPTVLISMGAGDPQNLTLRAAQALSALDPVFRARFVLGPHFKDKGRLAKAIVALRSDFETIEGADGLATEFATADIALVTCGVTAYEAAACGVPALYLSQTEEQLLTASALELAGMGISLGLASETINQSISKSVWALLRDGPRRREMHAAGVMTLDGNGAARIASELATAVAASRQFKRAVG